MAVGFSSLTQPTNLGFCSGVMSANFWKAPAYEVPIDKAVRVELLKLHNRDIISENGWPESFWNYVQDRKLLDGEEAQHVIQLFQKLSPGEPARCHMPPWELAFYDETELLFTTTLCFECSNAYVYTVHGKDLHAFDVSEPHAEELLAFLKQEFSLI
ncbi:hypothetical protein H6F59_17200 [Nodosilinea sp. FACHB-141]|uniref:SMI1/KNR4 family protein n=2 Tax=Leptolyngbya TaxID=47251 RepID=A0ABV0K475_9CYAN|nr:hypothetical protein [Nodosilinea sp. FACHB-141]MBD2113565.1 hypothetical protein [Nodosilinea sp. FACHB-141]